MRVGRLMLIPVCLISLLAGCREEEPEGFEEGKIPPEYLETVSDTEGRFQGHKQPKPPPAWADQPAPPGEVTGKRGPTKGSGSMMPPCVRWDALFRTTADLAETAASYEANMFDQVKTGQEPGVWEGQRATRYGRQFVRAWQHYGAPGDGTWVQLYSSDCPGRLP